MSDLEKYKFDLSQKYGISENSIDESILPILLALEENTKANRDISNKIKGSIQSIHYKDPKTAFWGNMGKYGIPSLIVGISIGIILLVWYSTYNNASRLNSFSSFVDIRGEEFFIKKENYRVAKDGIYINKNIK